MLLQSGTWAGQGSSKREAGGGGVTPRMLPPPVRCNFACCQPSPGLMTRRAGRVALLAEVCGAPLSRSILTGNGSRCARRDSRPGLGLLNTGQTGRSRSTGVPDRCCQPMRDDANSSHLLHGFSGARVLEGSLLAGPQRCGNVAPCLSGVVKDCSRSAAGSFGVPRQPASARQGTAEAVSHGLFAVKYSASR